MSPPGRPKGEYRKAQPAGIPVTSGLVAALFAVDPVGTGGVCLRGGASDARDAWLLRLRALLPVATPWKKLPLHVSDDRLLGGLDLAATLQAGRPVAQSGLLADCDAGVLVLAMAERMVPGTVAKLAAVIDTRQLQLQRDGLALTRALSFGVLALDEGIGADEGLAQALLDRLAFRVDFTVDGQAADDDAGWFDADEVLAARRLLPAVTCSDDIVQALCAATLALGVASARAPLLALRVARCAAALDAREAVSSDDAALAARLVLAPRATQLPVAESADDEAHEEPPADPEPEPSPAPEPPPPASPDAGPADVSQAPPLDDVVLAAAAAAIPAGLLAALKLGAAQASRASTAGKAGANVTGRLRGRPNGVRRGEPRGGARLNLIDTLRAAAPWQPLRRAQSSAAPGATSSPHIQVRREDFHVTRFKQRSQTTTVFVVDASGSSALHRLAEAKGAVELLLADCYVRRDSVAVLAFRGAGVELLLPPTRSLVRAKRSLAGLPGGGGTPLATAIDAAAALADAERRRGATPLIVLLTDGRANIARDGSPGRPQAAADALSAARRLRAAGCAALLLDTSPQPQAQAGQLADAMGAAYLPLPHAGAHQLSQAVRGAATQVRR